MSASLQQQLHTAEYAGYAYAYPHKTSYRHLAKPLPLADVWQHEDKSALFLYVHLPFCEMRCGFCNLFTTVRPDEDFVSRTLQAMQRQSRIVANAIAPERISQVAFGGGTPSYLSSDELSQLFSMLSVHWPVDWQKVQSSFEVSPATIDEAKLETLKRYHVDRISMGVQSFEKADLKSLGRPQKSAQVFDAIELIQRAQFPVFNLDLIYGVAGQTTQSWMRTLKQTVSIAPQEVYLYPLYVRELTGLGNTGKSPAENRKALYGLAVDYLLASGYRQVSMRLFRRHEVALHTDYCCQEDGMIGIGPGARSYTRALHYSSDYAVAQPGVRGIIDAYNNRSDQQHAEADYGAVLSTAEQKRRYVIKSLLHADGLSAEAYERRFSSLPQCDFPQLCELQELGLGDWQHNQLMLNDRGLAASDIIGPWLYSDEVVSRMRQFELV